MLKSLTGFSNNQNDIRKSDFRILVKRCMGTWVGQQAEDSALLYLAGSPFPGVCHGYDTVHCSTVG